MGAFKEEIWFLEEVKNRQSRVWPDSCDVGVSTHRLDLDRMRDVVKTLLNLPGSKVVWKADKPAVQRQYKFVVMWSRNEGKWFDATVADVLYYKDKRISFFSIKRIGPALVDENGKEMGS